MENEFWIAPEGAITLLEIYAVSGTIIKSIDNITEAINVSDLVSHIYGIKIKITNDNYTTKLIK